MRYVLTLLALSGCTATDPLYRTGLWRPTGANEANLRAMVADPDDLLNGMPSTLAQGTTAADAVARYRMDKVKPLPDSGLAKLKASSFGDTPQAAAAVVTQ